MVSRKNLIYGGIAILVVVGIILAVLGGMGYLNPKHLSNLPPGVPSLDIKNAVVTITDYDQTSGNVKYRVNNPDKEYAHSQPLHVYVGCTGSNCPSNTNKDLVEPIDIDADSGVYSFNSPNFIVPKGRSSSSQKPYVWIWVANGYSSTYDRTIE